MQVGNRDGICFLKNRIYSVFRAKHSKKSGLKPKKCRFTLRKYENRPLGPKSRYSDIRFSQNPLFAPSLLLAHHHRRRHRHRHRQPARTLPVRSSAAKQANAGTTSFARSTARSTATNCTELRVIASLLSSLHLARS